MNLNPLITKFDKYLYNLISDKGKENFNEKENKLCHRINCCICYWVCIISFYDECCFTSEREQTESQLKEAKKQTDKLSKKIKELNEALAAAEKKTEQASNSTLSLDEMRKIAKEYVDN